MASAPEDFIYPAIPVLPPGINQALITQAIIWAPQSMNVTHWRTSYVFAKPVNGQLGMSVDMFRSERHELHPYKPSVPNYFGALKLQPSDKKLFSTKTVVCEFIDFQSEVTVERLYDTIIDNNLHRYIFHDAGSGCMFWQLRLLDQFITNGWIAVGEAERVIKAIKAAAQRSGSSVLWPPVQGTFFS